jgi:hypothetical protein
VYFRQFRPKLLFPPHVSCAAFSGALGAGNRYGNLVAGDVVTITASGDISIYLFSDVLNTGVIESSQPGTYSYTVTAASAGNFTTGFTYNNGFTTYTDSWSCSNQSAANIQINGAQIEGQNSQSAINDILDGVIDGSLGDTFQGFSGNANGVAMMVAPGQQVMPVADAPRSMQSDSPWRMWMAGRYTHASGTETGDQFNGLFGSSYRIGQSTAVGLFGGYETFNYTDATPSQLSGNGLTLGGFAAGMLAERLKLDARVYTTFMNYNIATGATTGAFGAQRLGTTVTASYELGNGPVSFAPFVRGSGLFEWQNAYTNSAATAVPAQNLAQGTVSPGIRISRAMPMSNGATFTPYLTGEGDYVFGNTNLAGFTGTTGLSGKVSAGAQIQTFKGLSLGLDASYGGIGSSINSETLMGTLTIPF